MPEIKPHSQRPLIDGLLANLGQTTSAALAAVAQTVDWPDYVQPTIDFVQACADQTFSTNRFGLNLHNYGRDLPIKLTLRIVDEDDDDLILCEEIDFADAITRKHTQDDDDACEFEDTISQVEFLLIDLKRRFQEHYGQTVDKYRSDNKDYRMYIRT
jgi:hypothetical protein